MKQLKKYLKFFPLQLFFLHFKKNHVLLLVWGLLFGFVSQTVASGFGVPYLFLSPEYLNEVGMLSYFILGFAVGGFFMAFHLYSYLILGPSFPFIATLARPFYKFCINNSLIPTIFLVVMIMNICEVELYEDLKSVEEVVYYIIALLFGVVAFLLISMAYFWLTNKNTKKFNVQSDNLAKSFFIRPFNFIKIGVAKKYKPNFYMKGLFSVKPTRPVEHYERELFEKVLKQNYFNATLFELFVVISFLVLGIFHGVDALLIPAAASIILLFTLLIMIISIIYSWLKAWTTMVIVILVISFNYLSYTTSAFSVKSYAFGLNYDTKVDYKLEHLKSIQFNDSILQEDITHHLEILEKWKKKACEAQGVKKPKLIIVNISGGGIRSALWSFNVFQQLNTAFEGKFMNSTHLMTGASGGMLGACYFRELFYHSALYDIDVRDSVYFKNMGNDLLNSMSFSLITNDLFLRNTKTKYSGRMYTADRGYSFERDLNESTQALLNKPLHYYEKLEAEVEMPLVVLTPTIINDGRRLVIGAQPYSFLNGLNFENKDIGPENVELTKLFSNNNAMELKFLTALRMNATFPYVLPMVNLPTAPETAVMDAGIRDNYGIKTSIRYIEAFKQWFSENTSGIILVEIRDISKDYDLTNHDNLSIKDRLVRPIGNFYDNYLHSQEYNASEMIELLGLTDLKIDKIAFLLRKNPEEKISLSWHLTELEKQKVLNAFENECNQNELVKLIHLLR